MIAQANLEEATRKGRTVRGTVFRAMTGLSEALPHPCLLYVFTHFNGGGNNNHKLSWIPSSRFTQEPSEALFVTKSRLVGMRNARASHRRIQNLMNSSNKFQSESALHNIYRFQYRRLSIFST